MVARTRTYTLVAIDTILRSHAIKTRLYSDDAYCGYAVRPYRVYTVGFGRLNAPPSLPPFDRPQSCHRFDPGSNPHGLEHVEGDGHRGGRHIRLRLRGHGTLGLLPIG